MWVWSGGDGEAFKGRGALPVARDDPRPGLACADHASYAMRCEPAGGCGHSFPPSYQGTIITRAARLRRWPTGHREGRILLQECLPSLSICRRCLQIVRSSFARLCESFIPGYVHLAIPLHFGHAD